MELSSIELHVFVSLTVILGSALIALIVDYLKGSNEQLREHNIELRIRREEEGRRSITEIRLLREQMIADASGLAPVEEPANAVRIPEPATAATPVAAPPEPSAQAIIEQAVERAVRNAAAEKAESEPDQQSASRRSRTRSTWWESATSKPQPRLEVVARKEAAEVKKPQPPKPDRAPDSLLDHVIFATEPSGGAPPVKPSPAEPEAGRVVERVVLAAGPAAGVAAAEPSRVVIVTPLAEPGIPEISSLPSPEPAPATVEEMPIETAPAMVEQALTEPAPMVVEQAPTMEPAPVVVEETLIEPAPVMVEQAPTEPAPMVVEQAPTMEPAPVVVEETLIEPAPVMVEQAPPMEPAPVVVEETLIEPAPVMVEQAPTEPARMVVEQAPPMEPAPVVVEETLIEPAPVMVEQAPTEPARMVVEQAPPMEPAPVVVEETLIEPAPVMVEQAPTEPAPVIVEQAPTEPAPVIVEQAPTEPAPVMVEAAPMEPEPAEFLVPEIEPAAALAKAPQTETNFIPPVGEVEPRISFSSGLAVRREPAREVGPKLVRPVAELPKGFFEAAEIATLIGQDQPLTGVVVAIGVNDYQRAMQSQSQVGAQELAGSLDRLIQNLISANDFAYRRADDEFIVVFPNEKGAAAQNRIHQVAERLWDYQLRSLAAFSVLFSWGAVTVDEESFSEAVALATDEMSETRDSRRSFGMESLRARRRAANF